MKRALLALLALAACSKAPPPPDEGYGAVPALPAPAPQRVPTVRIADVTGWPEGRTPTAPAGWRVTRFAGGLNYPRWLYQLPNGDVLVSEARTTPKSDPGVMDRIQSAVVAPSRMEGVSANRVTLLRDTDGDGVADIRTTLIEGLRQPFGMAWRPTGQLLIANTDGVMAFPFRPGQTRIEQPGVKLFPLPAGGYNNHWTRNLLFAPDGALFVSIGSASNIMERGAAEDRGRAAIWRYDFKSPPVMHASGLRNPVGLAFEPRTGALWTAVNERDLLGDNLVPDYITSVKPGGFYGWPWSYDGRTVDARVRPPRPDMVARAIRPDYALGAHTASLGLAFATPALPAPFAEGAFVGQHGSWNRSAFAGYKVVFVPFAGGRPSGPPRDFLTGFLHGDGSRRVYGRPAGVLVDARGGVLVADDAGDTIWRVAPVAPVARAGAV